MRVRRQEFLLPYAKAEFLDLIGLAPHSGDPSYLYRRPGSSSPEMFRREGIPQRPF